MRLLRWLRWWFWRRPRFNYLVDREFGWPRWRALLRCLVPGRRLAYPPHVRREMRARAAAEAAATRLVSRRLLP